MQDLDQQMSPTTFTLGLLGVGALAGGAFGFVVHPGQQYVEPVQNQVFRSAVWGVAATAVAIGTLYVGMRFGAIPTA